VKTTVVELVNTVDWLVYHSKTMRT